MTWVPVCSIIFSPFHQRKPFLLPNQIDPSEEPGSIRGKGIPDLETGTLIQLKDVSHPELFLLFYRFCRFCVGSSLSRLFRVPTEDKIRKQERLAIAGVIAARPPALACFTDTDVDLWF